MPLSVSDHLGISAPALEASGAFNAIIDIDSRLFIDPLLVRRSAVPEFEGAADVIDARLSAVLTLLKASKQRGDVAWRNAAARLEFRELKGLAIGYSSKGTAGSGIGPGLRDRLLETAQEIVLAGVEDPALFELMGLLEEGIGADRISDMFARILIHPIFQFSERVFRELEIEGRQYRVGQTVYVIPANPFNRAPILLLPREVLRDLPIAESWSDIDYVVAANAELRQRVNALIGASWRNARRMSKAELRSLLVANPKTLQGLLDAYRKSRARPYNFKADPHGQVIWYAAAREAVVEHPLRLLLPADPSADDVLGLVRTIGHHFKDLVEQHKWWSLLYNPDGRPKREEAAQLLFYGAADLYCGANDIDVSREANAGRGPVDFKFSRGYRARAIAEAKLTTNPRLLHAYEKQVEAYSQAEHTTRAILLVVDVGGSREQLEALLTRRADDAKKGLKFPEIVYVDARPRRSASRAQ